MELIQNLWCTKCKTKEDLVKYSKSDTAQFYMCNSCNTARGMAYRKTKVGAERTRASVKASQKRNPGKQEARLELNKAVKRGEIKKPKKCVISDCKESKIQGHHPNYRNPLFAVFLCIRHHRQFHKKLS